ncbi:5-carboxymethyl-2-hydroxymuconate Delta-isomerase [Colwellia psychrerythraea]|uniref:5-carboxymethyl-2-hydroxymuconate isomerase n=1 Tax=Colwellia psychrerythraea TaxID=28229 RepID=A0A099L0P6_COLPS|nr:5-carboxymethyl-2-hydroxymuconate isomerase [Colwellia psychrerythraea]KGJ96015.1 hypothetical protein GAB14E_1766 [Colwellia psychrerythraea]
MPHCIIEHSSSIESNTLIPLVFNASMESSLFEKNGSDIKVRVLPVEHYQTGAVQSASSPADFIHVTMRILSGRKTEQKLMLSKLVLESLTTLALKGCSTSVEVVDIDRASYSKIIS